MTWLSETLELSQLESDLLTSLAIVVALVLVWLLIVRVIARRVDDTAAAYLTRKASSYVLVVIGSVALLWVWVGAIRELGTFLGLVAGGIAIALADVLKNVAGWLYLVLRRPYRVDDRIEIAGVRGDVIDIRLFRTTLLEIGNWVDADQSTGRIVHVPNGKIFSDHVFNATEGFGFIWHEIPLHLTFDSDWRRAETLLLDALTAAAGHTVEEAEARIRSTAKAYKIRYTHLTPTVYVSVRDRGIVLTGRLLVDARRRRGIEQQVWRGLLDAIAREPNVAIAYPTERRVIDHLVTSGDRGVDRLDPATTTRHAAPTSGGDGPISPPANTGPDTSRQDAP